MKNGNEHQRKAYEAIRELNIMKDMKAYSPVLCGTLPIGINVKGSDLDIILEVYDLKTCEEQMIHLYGDKKDFTIKRLSIRNREIIKANFFFKGFEFELFGQAQPVHKQYAYLHMIIEHELMKRDTQLKSMIIDFKERGYKTEPAFCEVLGLAGDPYEELIAFGVREGLIHSN
ncbi:DUF4269 domain-containing protein [Pseudalkalibacillus sp. SCS-8]|uniref:DUF4269 domain-containing protein n=1 Tax=Pseudalkalibacillus nanhaiensis TaxID=3115291 RepID=UPI0032DB9F78